MYIFFGYKAWNYSFYCNHHHIYAALWQAFSCMYMYFQPWYYSVSGMELCLALRIVKPYIRRRFLLNGIKQRRVFLKLNSQPDYYIFISEQPGAILSFLRLISSEATHFSGLACPFSFIFPDDKDSTAQENKRASTRITNWSRSRTQITFIIVNFLFKHQNRIVHRHTQ